MAKSKRKTTPQKPVADTIVPRLYLLTPVLSDVQAFAPELEAAMDAGDVACVLVQVTGNDEGEIKKAAQRLATIVQGREAALLVEGDPRIAARVNADGVHVRAKGEALGPALANAVESCRPDRIVGAGGLRSRDDAMTAGDFHHVLLGTIVMSFFVLVVNRLLWRPLYWYAERKFRLT